MELPTGLYAIQEPAAPARRKTLHIRLLCLHEPATARPVARPWPRQIDWRGSLRGQGSNLI